MEGGHSFEGGCSFTRQDWSGLMATVYYISDSQLSCSHDIQEGNNVATSSLFSILYLLTPH